MHDTAVFNSISNPVRRRILELLLSNPRSAGEIALEFELNRPTISEHVHVLENCGLVSEEASGRKNIFHLNPEPLKEVLDWLQPFQNYWNRRIAALNELLDKDKEL